MSRLTILLILCWILLSQCHPAGKISEITTTLPSPVRDSVSFDQPVLAARATPDSAYSPLRLAELHIRVEVLGHLAQTEMELVFHNATNSILEGELYFPLGDGQTVSGFAMDVNGALREAVPVEKAKGRQIFESIVREQVDPGLLEWTRGNTFRTRVYPIPANGYKRILVRFEQELTAGMQGPRYLLPLNFTDIVDEFSVDVKVLNQPIEPSLEENELMNFIFRNWQDAWIANSTYRNYQPNEQLGFSLPQNPFSQQVFVEAGRDDTHYFYCSLQPDMFLRERRKVRRIGLLWDCSLSAASRDTAREFQILADYFDYLGQVDVELIPFHSNVDSSQRFEIRNGKWVRLYNTLRTLPFDGATQLGALEPGQFVCDEYILISDGISNFGKSQFNLPGRPIHVLSTAPVAEFGILRQIATASGGRFLNANTLLNEDILRLLSFSPYRLLQVRVLKGEASAFYPPRPQEIQGRLSVSGKLISPDAEIELVFGFGNQIISRRKVRISRQDHLTRTGWVPRIWAQQKLQELDLQHRKNQTQIVEHCKEFGLVSRYTSLLILDRLEDYVQNRIRPPKELEAEYDRLVAEEDQTEEAESTSHLEEVVSQLEERKQWWSQVFEIPDKPQPESSTSSDTTQAFTDDWDVDGIADVYDSSPASDVLSESQIISADEERFDDDVDVAMNAEAVPEEKATPEKPTASIELNAWEPDTPYLQELKDRPASERYLTYLRLRERFGNMPAFFLDVSDFFRDQDEPALALRVLSNVAELELENHELLRILAHRLLQTGYQEEAISMFREVLRIREEEPQSYRDLAHALAAAGELQNAADMLYEVISRSWDGRFPEIGVLAAHELNSLIGQHHYDFDLSQYDTRLIADLPTDLRVVLNWDADNVDMDLWVTDPRGEKCFYSHARTEIGGRISSDFTGGYGPEEFLLKQAIPGEYLIQVDYFGSSRQRISGPVHIQAQLILQYGKPEQETQAITLRLGTEKEVIEVGRFVVE